MEGKPAQVPQTIKPCNMKCLFARAALLAFICLLSAQDLNATHNRAGEIRVVQLSALRVRATVITYTKSSSTAADRDTLLVNWGDGEVSPVGRKNGKGELLPNDIKRNIYEAEHDFPFRGTFIISVVDPNRIDNILNIDPPNSVNIPFYIQTSFSLINLQLQGKNNSAALLNAPIDFACVGQTFRHNPAAFDEDGDSLAFELITPLMDMNTPVPNYTLPSQIMPGINNVIIFDTYKGTITWQYPQKAGEYNIAFLIHEYRRGIKVSSTLRDMQIFVTDNCAKNNPPEIEWIRDTCIIAGQQLEINVTANDPDKKGKGSLVKLEAIGAPFLVAPSATFDIKAGYQSGPLQGRFIWNTNCSLVRKEPYTVVFKATDNLYDSTGIATLITWQIKVIAPAPTNLQAVEDKDKIRLFWDLPYFCNDGVSDFTGFSIWRKEGSIALPHDTCNPGLNGSSYIQIANLIKSTLNNKFQYFDSTIVRGKFYCYRVQAEFAKLSAANIPYNFISSLHSNEACLILLDERPILLNADVMQTDENQGAIYIRWQKPSTSIYDTTKYLPPYNIEIFSRRPDHSFSIIPTSNKTYRSFSEIVDTEFVHQGINTFEQHFYFVVLKSASNKVVYSDTGSTVFLKLLPGDKKISMGWQSITPWSNYKYEIYRKEKTDTVFSYINSTERQNRYVDFDLQNDCQYCYKVKALGTYGASQTATPLVNWSQVNCSTAYDNEPPCCPSLRVENPCKTNELGDSLDFVHVLKWNNPNLHCANPDAIGYRLYAYYDLNNPELLIQIDDIHRLEFNHYYQQRVPICYGIESFDEKQNTCSPRDTFCPIYCPYYKLPNTFTPNGDGANDIFKPYSYRFVESVDMKIFNRWGQLVFETTNPDILWNGTSLDGKKLSNGTYFYTCLVHYTGFTIKPKSEKITGFIELLGQ